MKKQKKKAPQIRTNRKQENEDSKESIISALSNRKWEYRTARGIARDVGRTVDGMEKTLDKMRDIVRVSVTKTEEGEKLYALKERKTLLGDYWSAFKSMNVDKFGGGK